MKEKKISRKDLKNFFGKICCFFIVMLIVWIILQENSIFYMALIFDCFYVLHHFLCRRKFLQELEKHRDMFETIKAIHARRYRCYLNGDEEKIAKYSEAFNICINELLQTREVLINNEIATKKEREEIENVMKETEALTKNIVPLA